MTCRITERPVLRVRETQGVTRIVERPVLRMRGQVCVVDRADEAPDLHHWWEAWDDVALLTIDGTGVLAVANRGTDETRMQPYPGLESQRLQYSPAGGPNDRPYFYRPVGAGFDTLWALPAEPIPAGTELAIATVFRAGGPSSWPISIGWLNQWAALQIIGGWTATETVVYAGANENAPNDGLFIPLDSEDHTALVVYRADSSELYIDGELQDFDPGIGGAPRIDYAWFYCGDPTANPGRPYSLRVMLNPAEARVAAFRAALTARYGLAV